MPLSLWTAAQQRLKCDSGDSKIPTSKPKVASCLTDCHVVNCCDSLGFVVGILLLPDPETQSQNLSVCLSACLWACHSLSVSICLWLWLPDSTSYFSISLYTYKCVDVYLSIYLPLSTHSATDVSHRIVRPRLRSNRKIAHQHLASTAINKESLKRKRACSTECMPRKAGTFSMQTEKRCHRGEPLNPLRKDSWLGIRNPPICLSVSLQICLSVSLCASVSVSQTLCLCLSLSLSLSRSRSVSPPLSLSVLSLHLHI